MGAIQSHLLCAFGSRACRDLYSLRTVRSMIIYFPIRNAACTISLVLPSSKFRPWPRRSSLWRCSTNLLSSKLRPGRPMLCQMHLRCHETRPLAQMTAQTSSLMRRTELWQSLRRLVRCSCTFQHKDSSRMPGASNV